MIRIRTSELENGSLLSVRFLELATSQFSLRDGRTISDVGEPPKEIKYKGKTYVHGGEDVVNAAYLCGQILGPLYFVDAIYSRS